MTRVIIASPRNSQTRLVSALRHQPGLVVDPIDNTFDVTERLQREHERNGGELLTGAVAVFASTPHFTQETIARDPWIGARELARFLLEHQVEGVKLILCGGNPPTPEELGLPQEGLHAIDTSDWRHVDTAAITAALRTEQAE